ncbi:MAG: MmcQ/YjbR family DNA-binding protein [bacterium]
MNKNKPTHKDLKEFREFALSFPEAVEEFPFGHSVIKVNKKAFVFLGTNEEGKATIALKLPHSGEQVRKLSCAQPTGYGLGKSGWVTVALASRDTPSPKTLRLWIEESYHAIASKKLLTQLDSEMPS